MMTQSKASALPRSAPADTGVFKAFVQIVATWQTRRAARRALARLDDYLLRDIGLDPLSAHHEAAKRFWRD